MNQESKKWNEWFQNRLGDVPQSKELGVIALDYSTFLEQVLMNYAAYHSEKNNLNNDVYFEKWIEKKNSRKH